MSASNFNNFNLIFFDCFLRSDPPSGLGFLFSPRFVRPMSSVLRLPYLFLHVPTDCSIIVVAKERDMVIR